MGLSPFHDGTSSLSTTNKHKLVVNNLELIVSLSNFFMESSGNACRVITISHIQNDFERTTTVYRMRWRNAK